MSFNNFHLLFAQLLELTEKYKKQRDYTGDNFNIFQILRLDASEVGLHSPLIAELLNPLGSHDQGSVFLKLFSDMFCFKNYQIDVASCRVEVEKHTGFISQDRLEGGRLDICITDQNRNKIIIENKIYAGDQEKQMVRYNNHCSTANLLYLTLDGRSPSLSSIGDLKLDIDYKCISYKTDIIAWLELCRKEAVELPIIRETISQYIHLLKYLTNQSTNHFMQQEINKIIADNMQASIIIADNLRGSQTLILRELRESLLSAVEEKGFELAFDITLNKRYNGFYLQKPEWKELRIVFQFQNSDRDMIYGIATIKDPDLFPLTPLLRQQISSLPGNNGFENRWWPWYRPMEAPYDNWHNYEAWEAIRNGSLLTDILKKVDDLVLMIGAIDL